MKQDSNFTLLSDDVPRVRVTFDGKELQLVEGCNLAAALLESGIKVFRQTTQDTPRAPYCMMGSCFECLVEIDGETKQACMEKVTPDMQIQTGGKGDRF